MSDPDINKKLHSLEVRMTILEEKIDYLDKYKELLLKNNGYL
jgi:hypothetical protein